MRLASRWTARAVSLLRRIRRLPLWLSIPGGLILLVLLGGAVYKGVPAYKYMQEDPSFCASCHIMQPVWDKWSISEHKDVTCHKCHELSPMAGTQLLLTWAIGRPEKLEVHTFVPDEACVRCHKSGNPEYKQIGATVGHKVHPEEQSIACIRCHGIQIHSFRAPGKVCLTCHPNQQVQIPGMSQTPCLACHQYLRPVTASEHPLLPDRSVCLGCHLNQKDTKVTWPADAPMQFECRQCHKPHVQAEPVVNCQSCHAAAIAVGLHTGLGHQATSCTTCHKPHEWKVTERSTCLACHAPQEQHFADKVCIECHKFQ